MHKYLYTEKRKIIIFTNNTVHLKQHWPAIKYSPFFDRNLLT